MAQHVVDQLDLRFDGPVPPGIDARDVAERFTRDVLERACDAVERRLRGRTLVVRTLAFRAHLTAAELANPVTAQETADELAAALERIVDRAPAEPTPTATAAVFDTAEQMEVIALSWLARQDADDVPPWFAPHFTRFDQCLTELLEPPQRAVRVLNTLAELGKLAQVVRAADGLQRRRIAELIARAPWDDAVSDFTRGLVDTVLRSISLPRIPDAENKRAIPVPPNDGCAAPSSFPQSPAATSTSASQTPDPTTATEPRPFPPPAPRAPIPTAAAGLFYLLNPALELDAGQALWQNGIDEPQAFRDATALLVPHLPPDDPAPDEFAGHVTTAQPIAWPQADALAAVFFRALTETAARREMQLQPLIRSHARLHGVPVVLFGLPLYSPVLAVATGDAAHTLSELWPAGGTRERATTDTVLPEAAEVEAYLASGELDDAPRRAVAATLAGALGAWACLRIAQYDRDVGDPAAILADAIARSGELVALDDELVIRLPADRVQFPIRRAGLDRDPGWIPWQRRRVRFEFAPSPTTDAGAQ